MASIEMNLNVWPVKDVLPTLLLDRTTKKNIIFATDSYAGQGQEYGAKNHITEEALKVLDIKPRVLKNAEEQVLRTRKKAEVFTPSWVCCMMINHCDADWFGRDNVFNTLNCREWTVTEGPVKMPKRKRWQDYVDSRRLEITCGEAPYLASRYNMETGEIVPVKDRIGILDRKLRIVSENAADEAEWVKWAIRSLQAVYGYEYQGDNLLIARVNLLMTFVEYMKEIWSRDATAKELQDVADIISWNVWQMDGLKGTIPMGALYEQCRQMTFFEMFGAELGVKDEVSESVPSRIYDWRGRNRSVEFNAFREGRNGSMKFDFIIGNPPYQDETLGDNKGFAPPIYDKFMDASYEVADKVELIHPARFLFNAGSTPKAWNEKMLNDSHLKVLSYIQNASSLFPNINIMGGIAITYHDSDKNFGAIKTFTAFSELNAILRKVDVKSTGSLMEIIYIQNRFDLDKLYTDFPQYMDVIGSNGRDKRFRNNIFDKIPLFVEEKRDDDDIVVLGIQNNKRKWMYFPVKYIDLNHENLGGWKVLVPRANGAKAIGETDVTPIIGEPVIARPMEGYTQSFIGIGCFETEYSAQAAMKYVKSKFARTMLGILKITQDNNRETWKYVPLQDFTANSDIDWSVPIKAIDQQLYKKYGLSDDEITFIETHVKEMS